MARVRMPKMPKISRKQAVVGTISLAVLILVCVLIWLFVRMRSSTKAVQAPATITVTPATVTPTTIAYMTDAQASTYAYNLTIYNDRASTQAQRDAACLALYPLINLSLTPAQNVANNVNGPDSVLRKVVAADYATIQAGGHA